ETRHRWTIGARAGRDVPGREKSARRTAGFRIRVLEALRRARPESKKAEGSMETAMGNAAKLRVMDVFERTVRSQGPRPALRVKRNGAWQTTTWDEYHKQVRQVARALIAIGTEPGRGVAIIGYNCPEWFFADIGAIYAG